MENRLITVDTDVVIDFFSNVDPGADVVSKLIYRKKVILTSITVFELYAGIEGKKRLRQIETLIKNVTIIALDIIGAAMAGKIYTQLKSKGELIGTHDILIAGICLANRLPLYTKNTYHFSRIQGIQILSAEEILNSF